MTEEESNDDNDTTTDSSTQKPTTTRTIIASPSLRQPDNPNSTNDTTGRRQDDVVIKQQQLGGGGQRGGSRCGQAGAAEGGQPGAGGHHVWNVWKAATSLEERATDFYPTITPHVVTILRQWGTKWSNQPAWKSILDKRTLLKEMEESIAALHYLLEGIAACGEPLIVVDVCAGKGLFSFLLRYYISSATTPLNLNVQEIIVLEKDNNINWHHIHVANQERRSSGENDPLITIWANTNLHDYDDVLTRLMELATKQQNDCRTKIAMIGIHLCKQLSPIFCGLVNGLGPARCIYAGLVPCCMPRAVTAQKNKPHLPRVIEIPLWEPPNDRTFRLHNKERERLMKEHRQKQRQRQQQQQEQHRQQTSSKKDDAVVVAKKEENSILLSLEQEQEYYASITMCWICRQVGHFGRDCPTITTTTKQSTTANGPPPPQSLKLPTYKMDVTGILREERPYFTYCHLLSESLQNTMTCIKVIETPLMMETTTTMDTIQEEEKDKAEDNSSNSNGNSRQKKKQKQHQEGNWNIERKGIYIVATPSNTTTTTTNNNSNASR